MLRAANGVIDDQDNYGADYSDQNAVKVQAGDARLAEAIEEPATHYSADDSEEDVEYQSLTGFVDDLASDETGN
jgi:hypothetical protein